MCPPTSELNVKKSEFWKTANFIQLVSLYFHVNKSTIMLTYPACNHCAVTEFKQS